MKCLGLALVFFLLLDRPASGDTLRGEYAGGAEVVRELNLARQHPEVYAALLEQRRDKFHGCNFVTPSGRVVHTHEGVRALDEAVRFLHRVQPLGRLTFSAGLSLAAAAHVSEQASGTIGHAGLDRSGPGDRIDRYGSWSGRWGEDIAYGRRTARGVVIALIVDDGLRERAHRKIIFNPAFHYAGAAAGPHARYRVVCSIDFAGGYIERDAIARSLLAGN
jgi:uncharacterized protein YkwD